MSWNEELRKYLTDAANRMGSQSKMHHNANSRLA